MPRTTGLWVYQTRGPHPDPDAAARQARQHGIQWLTAQATAGHTVLDHDWLRAMRRATKQRGMRLRVHG